VTKSECRQAVHMTGEDYPIDRHSSPECVGAASPVILSREKKQTCDSSSREARKDRGASAGETASSSFW
jgi:hypothetical protein